MSAGLALILVVVAAYLAAHVVSEWLARRYLVVSGAEYLLLGFLLGPQVSGVLTADMVGGFAPLMTLAFGWIGALVGAQFFVPELLRLPAISFRIAFAEAMITLIVIGGLMGGTLAWWFALPGEAVVAPAVALGAIAVVSGPAGIAMVARAGRARSPLLRQLQITAAVDAAVAILAFGLLLSITHPGSAALSGRPTATEWTMIAVGIGVVGGTLFHLFLGVERNIDRLFVALSGALILASGAAAYLRLSPLLPAMLIGFVLVNTSAARTEIRQVLGRVERPLYYVLLIFAGVAWQPGSRAWLVPALLFLAARPLAKLGGARLAARAAGSPPGLGPDWGIGLLGHGGLALAIAFNFQLYDDSALGNIVFTTAIASVVLTDLFSARIVQAVVGSQRIRSSRDRSLEQEPEAP